MNSEYMMRSLEGEGMKMSVFWLRPLVRWLRATHDLAGLAELRELTAVTP